MEERIVKKHKGNEDYPGEDGGNELQCRGEETNDKERAFRNQQTSPIINLLGSTIQEHKEMKQRKKKALPEFRCMVEDAILGNYLLEKPNNHMPRDEIRRAREKHRQISLWGVPLLPSKGHEGTDILLLKFLKAKEYKPLEAFEMLRRILKWRKEYNIDAILGEDKHHPDHEKAASRNRVDKQGHPLYFNLYGSLKDKGLHKKVLRTEEGCDYFLKWMIQDIEKTIQELSFKPGGANAIVQIIDLKNSPGPELKELRSVGRKAFTLLQSHYPEIIHKNILVNVPFWYHASQVMASKLISPGTRKKFVFSRPSKVTQTLLKYISPENLPVEYGGLYRESDADFTTGDKAQELIVRPNAASCIKIPVDQAGVTIAWDFTVVGWDVTYKEEFIPDDEGSYRVLLQKDKGRRLEESVRNSFYISEPGKIVIKIYNTTLKKKRVYYRSKTQATVPIYVFFQKKH